MKKRYTISIITLILASVASWAASPLDSLITAIDNALDNESVYNARKQAKITPLKTLLSDTRGDILRSYRLNERLFNEYKAYKCDSAVFYLSENIDIALYLKNTELINRSRMRLAYYYGSSGRYESAIDLMHLINRSTITGELTPIYYSCYDHIYGEMATNGIGGKQLNSYYADMLKIYKDSLFNALSHDSEKYMELRETQLRDENHYDAALKINSQRIAKLTPDSAQYALVMFQRSMAYRSMGDSIMEMTCLARSALSDIKLATKDHASLWILAEYLYRAGDFDRANRYMRYSWDCTNFYNAPIRYWQSSSVQRIIDNQFQDMLMERNHRLWISILAIGALAFLLLLAMAQIIRQKKRLSVAHTELQNINTKLNSLNSELSRVNADLTEANTNLQESSCIKEVYISRFIKLCSEYIDKLEKYRVTMHKGLTQGKTADLLKLTRSSSFLNNEVKVLYENFDTAFLHIFPDFVEQFNSLLLDEEKIVLKPDELLNTELRIFALIRLGFNDSSQIAEILRYSVNTIYNYRAKVKNKARGSRADFEDLVRNIH